MNTDYEAYPRYSGVGGWLLFFVLILTVFFPLSRVYDVFAAVRTLESGIQITTASRDLMIATRFCGLIFAGWSVFCGVLLAKSSRGAVRSTKIFLFGYLLLALAVFTSYAVLTTVPVWSSEQPTSSLLYLFLERILFAALWYAYLSKSERVAATYGALSPPKTT